MGTRSPKTRTSSHHLAWRNHTRTRYLRIMWDSVGAEEPPLLADQRVNTSALAKNNLWTFFDSFLQNSLRGVLGQGQVVVSAAARH